ncbi:hypothetical protein AQUCO_02200157v1 [Aquilegia coerulea]|uniref:F-box/LRR-repeat protein 15/At3g58940/PEG3-like LRR domain-containing protein n=1 Tax=Aquilegia coerulea TaxID=218851 RepID=A0A2G5DDH3_AQUCA|nr:hypothetical protein AQUCO_02200157v1 [Aquilegia coerulea]
MSLFDPNDDVVGPHVGEWISLAVAHNLCKLNLSAFWSYKMLPSSFFTCKTLTDLTMSGIHLNLPSVVTFPNLKTLTLSRCRFIDNNAANKLFSSCPDLQIMDICSCYFEDINDILITISNLNLKYLRLSYFQPETKITCTVLNQLIFTCEYNSTIIDLGVIPSLRIATFNFSTGTLKPFSTSISIHSTRDVPTSRRASKILTGLCNVEKLTLGGVFIEVFFFFFNIFLPLYTSSFIHYSDLRCFTVSEQGEGSICSFTEVLLQSEISVS